MRRLILALGVVAAVGFALGCGSGEDETSTSTTPLTKAEFKQQAEAICEESSKQFEAEFAAWKEEYPGGPAEAEKNLDEWAEQIVAPVVRQKAEDLESLPAPTGDEAEVSQAIESLSRAAVSYEEEGAKALLGPATRRARSQMFAYGLRACAYLGSN